MIAFWILATVLVASAVWTIAASKPVYSVVALLAELCGARRALRDALGRVPGGHTDHRLLRRDPGAVRFRHRAAEQRRDAVCDRSESPAENLAAGAAFVGSGRASAFLIFALSKAATIAPRPTGPVGAANVFGSVADFGTALFTVQLLPFEVTALILMVAVIGVITLGGEQMRDGGAARARGEGRALDARGDPARGQGMMAAPLANYVALAAVMFFIGVIGVIVRRNPLVMLMSIELMFNAANLLFIAFARAWLQNAGQVFAFLVITVAAAEAAIGLAIVVTTFRPEKYVDVDDVRALHG